MNGAGDKYKPKIFLIVSWRSRFFVKNLLPLRIWIYVYAHTKDPRP